jgi:antitoxin VapB
MSPAPKERDVGRRERQKRCRGKALNRARIDEIVAQFTALPVVDDRSPDELIGYDERGLPS